MAKPRYQELYEKEIVPAMQEKFGYKNKHEIPKLDKIVINMGVGEATQDRKHIENAQMTWFDRWSKAGCHKGTSIKRIFQNS